jgi:hypothetical protein
VGEVQGQYLQDSLGDTFGSLHSYEKGLQIRRQLARSGDWKDQLALAKSYRLVASQLWATGDLSGAVERIGKAIFAADPERVAKSLQRCKAVLAFGHEELQH